MGDEPFWWNLSVEKRLTLSPIAGRISLTRCGKSVVAGAYCVEFDLP